VREGASGRGLLMFDQLAYLEHHQPWLRTQVPNFAAMQGGQLLRQFRTQLSSLGYKSFHCLLEAKDLDSSQHRFHCSGAGGLYIAHLAVITYLAVKYQELF
jgi:site-specific DNA-cytosine methylase